FHVTGVQTCALPIYGVLPCLAGVPVVGDLEGRQPLGDFRVAVAGLIGVRAAPVPLQGGECRRQRPVRGEVGLHLPSPAVDDGGDGPFRALRDCRLGRTDGSQRSADRTSPRRFLRFLQGGAHFCDLRDGPARHLPPPPDQLRALDVCVAVTGLVGGGPLAA